MAQKIARAVAYPLRHRRESAIASARIAIVCGSALALIMAGPSLPF
ncbi:hypothetical protein [Croceicoccus naphthovorans]|nr:hypothetical protein [Croceicoccus naphthovorans]MBB3989177.1 hypothetical protein [Croceicoccus naphthovorans]